MIMISGNYLVDILSPWFVQMMPLSVQGTNGTVCLLVSHQSLPVDFQQALPTHYTVSIFPQRSGIVPLYSIRESAGDSTASVLVQTVQSSASTCVLQSLPVRHRSSLVSAGTINRRLSAWDLCGEDSVLLYSGRRQVGNRSEAKAFCLRLGRRWKPGAARPWRFWSG